MLFIKNSTEKRFEEVMEFVDSAILEGIINCEAGNAAKEAAVSAVAFNLLIMTGKVEEYDKIKALYRRRINTIYGKRETDILSNLFNNVLDLSVESGSAMQELKEPLGINDQLVFYVNELASLGAMIQIDRERYLELDPEGDVIRYSMRIADEVDLPESVFIDNVKATANIAATINSKF